MNGHQSNVAVRELDWRHPVPACTGEFSWTPEDQTTLQHTSLVLAADGELGVYTTCGVSANLSFIILFAVIYDDSLTDAFFNCLVPADLSCV